MAHGQFYTVNKTMGGWASVANMPEFKTVKAQLQFIVNDQGQQKQNEFCVVGQSNSDYAGAYIYWKTRNLLIFWLPDRTDAQYDFNVDESRFVIDLGAGLRDVEDRGNHRDEMQRSYAMLVLGECAKIGDEFLVTKSIIVNPGKRLELDPEFSVTGMIQRLLLADIAQPGMPDFDPSLDLPQMRLLKRVLDNRMQHPEIYLAAGAKDERDILLAPGQFQEFIDYPKNFPVQMIADDVEFANIKGAYHAVYQQRVLDAIKVSHEIVKPAQVLYPDATAWYQDGQLAP